MAYVEISLDEFSDEELIDEMKLRNLHVVDAKKLLDVYKTQGKDAFHEAAKNFVEEKTGYIML